MTAAIGALASMAMLIGFMLWAAHAIDEGRLGEESRFVREGLHEFLDRVPHEQESITVWDDAVLKLRANDHDWIRDNLGEWVHDYFGHDEVYIVDATDAPVYAMDDGRTLPAARYNRRVAQIAPLIEQLRRSIAGADATTDIGTLGAKELVLEDGVPALFSVKPVVPSTDAVNQPRGTEYLHVAVRRLDADLLAAIGTHFQLRQLRLLAPDDANDGAAAAVTDSKGRILAFLGWESGKPGESLMRSATPGLISAASLALASLMLLLIRLRSMANDLTVSEAQTRFLAFHDTMTGLANRALFESRLDYLVASHRNAGRGLALHIVDIDRFKSVNDTFGHPAGDELIRLTAARLTELVRGDDIVARLGGDEFAVIQAHPGGEADARALAERIVSTMARPYEIFGKVVQSSGSIGTLFSTPDAQASSADLLRQADIALYEAKVAGRGRYAMFAEQMDARVRDRRQLEEDLRLALEMGSQIAVDYQPLFGVDGQTMLGAEALVRWDHPTRGRLPPEAFLHVVEENALSAELGEVVLHEATQFAIDAKLPFIAVNISPAHFRAPDFAGRVLRILSETGLPANRLELEITETALIDRRDAIGSTIGRLRAAGVRIVLDDFGTGYCSMGYLRRYALDKLKIDRSFIAELGTSTDAEAIIRAMVQLARSMGLGVTAEGVETEEQRQRLVSLGCGEMQGFLLGSPMSRGQMLLAAQQALVSKLRA